MSKISIIGFLLLAAFCACKTTTNPLDGQQLRLITSDQDTTSIVSGPVTITLTVLEPSGYGASGAYIDFYDPIEQRVRHEGPTPEDGQLQFTDTISASMGGGNFEFAFVAEGAGASTSDSVKLWIAAKDIHLWVIDSIAANSYGEEQIGVQWSRPTVDLGADTIFVRTSSGLTFPPTIVLNPQNHALIFVSSALGIDTITIHNAYASSQPIAWAPAEYHSDTEPNLQLYPNGDSNYFAFWGLDFELGQPVE